MSQPSVNHRHATGSAEPIAWPPLIYDAHIPWYIRLRDLVITLIGWVLVIDLLEDIWVLITQWLHVNVFRRKVELEHLFFVLWDNVHSFFYISILMSVVVVLVGLASYRTIRRPLSQQSTAPSAEPSAPTLSDSTGSNVPRLVTVQFDDNGQMTGVMASDR